MLRFLSLKRSGVSGAGRFFPGHRQIAATNRRHAGATEPRQAPLLTECPQGIVAPRGFWGLIGAAADPGFAQSEPPDQLPTNFLEKVRFSVRSVASNLRSSLISISPDRVFSFFWVAISLKYENAYADSTPLFHKFFLYSSEFHSFFFDMSSRVLYFYSHRQTDLLKWQGRTMADQGRQTGESMTKTITSLSFNVKRTKGGSQDAELIGLANEFVRLPGNEGISPTPLIRNFFIRKFREAIATAKTNQLAAS
jgi:hypothetical protein